MAIMKKSVIIIVMMPCAFLVANKADAQLGVFDYSLYFYQSPIETIYNGYPAMRILVNYG